MMIMIPNTIQDYLVGRDNDLKTGYWVRKSISGYSVLAVTKEEQKEIIGYVANDPTLDDNIFRRCTSPVQVVITNTRMLEEMNLERKKMYGRFKEDDTSQPLYPEEDNEIENTFDYTDDGTTYNVVEDEKIDNTFIPDDEDLYDYLASKSQDLQYEQILIDQLIKRLTRRIKHEKENDR